MAPADSSKRSGARASLRKRRVESSDALLQSYQARLQADTDQAVDSSEDSDEGSGGTKQEIVDCDIEFYDPKAADFNGLKDLLQPLLDGGNFDVNELVEVILSQAMVGTVIKTAEDEDPMGIITVLNLQKHKELRALQQFGAFLRQGCTSSEQQAKLQEAWDSHGAGLILSERVYNCPPQVAPPLQQALFDEIAWATEDEPNQTLRKSFQFTKYLMVTRAFTSLAAGTQPSAPAKKKNKRPKVPVELIYMRTEDEFYHKHCTWSFTFAVTTRPAGYEDLEQIRLCMLLSPMQVNAARRELDDVVGNLAVGQQAVQL